MKKYVKNVVYRRLVLHRIFNGTNLYVRHKIAIFFNDDIDNVFEYAKEVYDQMYGLGLDLYSPSYLTRLQNVPWDVSHARFLNINGSRIRGHTPTDDYQRFNLVEQYTSFCVQYGFGQDWYWIAAGIHKLSKCRVIHRSGTYCKHAHCAWKCFKRSKSPGSDVYVRLCYFHYNRSFAMRHPWCQL